MRQLLLATAAAALIAGQALAQDDQAAADDTVLSDSDLDTLVAPVALYPDTLLVQILIAAASPLDVVKAERLLQSEEGADIGTIKSDLADEGLDESVTVLATAFPDVLGEMSDHIEWTESLGDAMMAQEDDVMAAVQRMRDQAIDTGALVSNDEQVVETDDDDNVVIAPSDPQKVYVPSYDPNVVYDSSLDDALIAGAVGFGTFALMDAIFDDDDDWDDYWGCRHCAGWDDGPIIRDPEINIDGNVIRGNDIDINRKDVREKIKDNDIGWKPDPAKKERAHEKIAARRDESGKTRLPIKKDEARGAELQKKLQQQPVNRPDRPAGAGAHAAGVEKIKKKAPAAGTAAKKANIKRPEPGNIKKPKAVNRSAIQQKAPAIKKASAHPRAQSAIHKAGSGSHAKAAKVRARPHGGKIKRR
ncbi:DUF3300 domain-containing protein [Qingshengfaniella alkalisoli]|nr:DUF3300 domain-containing protein [Qingshengfaniella alkalisoli]